MHTTTHCTHCTHADPHVASPSDAMVDLEEHLGVTHSTYVAFTLATPSPLTAAPDALLTRMLIRLFRKSLTSSALKWFTSLDMATIKTWDDFSQAFLE